MVVRAFFCLLLALLPLSAKADTGRVDRIDIVEAGTYAPSRKAQGSVTLVKKTDTAAARLGLLFGVRYTPVGTPAGAPLDLRVVTKFPGSGATDPGTGKVVTKSEEKVKAAVGVSLVSGYRLDKTWEVLPGVWTVEIWDGQRKLAEKTFTLTER